MLQEHLLKFDQRRERITSSLESLTALQAWNEEQPTEILHSTSSNNKSKWRKGWFTSVIGEVQLIKRHVAPSLPAEILIRTTYLLRQVHDVNLVTQEMITEGNNVLAETLEYLKSETSPSVQQAA